MQDDFSDEFRQYSEAIIPVFHDAMVEQYTPRDLDTLPDDTVTTDYRTFNDSPLGYLGGVADDSVGRYLSFLVDQGSVLGIGGKTVGCGRQELVELSRCIVSGGIKNSNRP